MHVTCLNKIPGRFLRFLMRGNMQRSVPFPKGHGDPEPAASHLSRWRLGLTVLLPGAVWWLGRRPGTCWGSRNLAMPLSCSGCRVGGNTLAQHSSSWGAWQSSQGSLILPGRAVPRELPVENPWMPLALVEALSPLLISFSHWT